MTLLSDPEFIVRFATAKAIGRTFNNWFHATAVCIAMLKDGNESNRAMGAECLLSVRRHVKDDLDMLKQALVDAPWDVRLDIEEVLAELRRE
jgi:HEAT repeat protein